MIEDKIIHFLKTSPGYISGEEISQHLKISRAGIWKHIQELRKEGYDIVAVPHLGYRLEASPDKLIAREIQFGLGTKAFGKKIIAYESIDSTMDAAFDLGVKGSPEGTVVCAESQLKGRGRLGRAWVSPKGKGLYLSLILRPPFAPNEVARLTLMTAVAVSLAIKIVSNVEAQIKWPNDLLVNNRKLAGILTELSAETDRVKFVVVGIGLNVNTPPGLLPSHSTSLKQELNRTVSRVTLMQEMLRQMEKWYEILIHDGFAQTMQRWRQLSVTLRKRIRIADANGITEGEAIDIDSDGGLLIREDSGVIVKRMSGDVVQVG